MALSNTRPMEGSTRGRGRPALGLNHDEVFDAVIAALAASGEVASMTDIAARCGVAKTTLHDRFGSKDALVARAVDRERERLADHLISAYREQRHDDRRGAQMRSGFEALFSYARAHPASFQVLFGAARSPAVHRARADIQNEIATIVAERFAAAGLELGWSRQVIAAVIVGAGESVARLLAEEPGKSVDIDAVTDLVAGIVTNGLPNIDVVVVAEVDTTAGG